MVLPAENKPPKVHLEDSSHIRMIKELIDYFDKIKNKLENPDDGNFRTTTADTNVNDKEKHKAQAEKLQRELCNVTRELSNFWKLDDLVASSCSGLDSNPRLDLHTVPETPAQLEDTFRLVAEMVQNLKRKVKAAEEPFTLTFEPYYLVHKEKNEGLGMRNRIETASYYRNCLHYDPVGMFGKLKDYSRECLKYFSVFPENAVLRKSLLKNWWIGEGLFANTPEGRGKVDEALIHLLKKGFIEPFLKKRKLVGFKVDPLIRFNLIKFAKHEKFSSFDAMGVPVVTSTTEKAFLVKHGEYCSRNDDVLHHGNLKTLFNVNDSYPDFKEDWFSKLRNLEVLSLGGLHGSSGQEIQDTENNKDFKFKGPHGTRGLLRQHIEIEDAQFLKGMKNMKELKFLGLQGISRLMKIPESIGNLSKLEVLDLCACHNLESLPKGLVKLKNLTHLDLSECYLLDIIPKGVASLSKLQVLKGFLIGSSTKGACSLADLKSLRDLRKLSIYTNNPEFPSEKDLTALESFKSLENLAIVWGGKFLNYEEKVKKGMSEKNQAERRNDSGTMDESNPDWYSACASIPPVKQDNCLDKIPEDGEIESSMQSRAPVRQPVSVEQKKDARPFQLSLCGRNSEGSVRMQNMDKKTMQSDILVSAEPTQEVQTDERTEISRASTGGIRKLELQCFPGTTIPGWVLNGKLKPQKKLYIGGGNLRSLGRGNLEWMISILRLKFLSELELDWTELRKWFPKLIYLEKVRCPKLTLFPCDNTGVWCKREVQEEDLVSLKLGLAWSFLKNKTY